MTKTIVQKITFKNTTTDELYKLYMDEQKHSEVTGSKAKIKQKEGTNFVVYDGYIIGRNIQLINNSLIVQSWRASDWDDSDIDSTFIIYFIQHDEDVVVSVVHANLPIQHAESISKGWHEFYWKPWKLYLKNASMYK